VVDILLQERRDGKVAKCVFKQFLKKCRNEPRKIVTDKLKSYGVAQRELVPDTIHDTFQYVNSCGELSHQPTRVREQGMRRFKLIDRVQRFLDMHTAVYNLFNLVPSFSIRQPLPGFETRGLCFLEKGYVSMRLNS